MAALLATCTKEEQCSVICFLSSEGVKPIEIHRQMKVQYCDAYLSLQQVYEWTGKFMKGISSVTDSPRPGQSHRVVTPEGIATVEDTVKENRSVTANEVATHLDINGTQRRLKNEVIVCILCSIKNEIKNIYLFHLTQPRIITVHTSARD
jgi:hypothetical protein